MRLPPAMLLAASAALAAEGSPLLDQAFGRLYNFDFAGAQALVDRHIAAHPADPLGYAVRASGLVFLELDRLAILESEFFADDKRVADKKRLKPDPAVRERFFRATEDARVRAEAVLAQRPNDTGALFTLAVTYGVLSDYTALIEKRQIGSFGYIKQSTLYAQRLLRVDPNFHDAYFSTGLTEYLIGSLPFFVRWFVRVDQIEGSKQVGMASVERTARDGRYLKPFAKIVLATGYLREKQPSKARALLADLAREFPENPLFRKELAKVTDKLRTGELRDR